MKIIHCADLHLDSKMETNLSAEQAKKRRYEILDTFERMVHFAVQREVKVILIAGDLFDTPQNKQNKVKNRVMDLIRENEEIDFLYLKGNHDNSLYFESLEQRPRNLKLFQEGWSTYHYGEVAITGYEFGESADSNYYADLKLSETDMNIVAIHGQTVEYSSSNQKDGICLKELKNRFVDYLALGHIHTYEKGELDTRGIYCYPGCLEGRGFDECGKKGFVLLTIENHQITSEFCPFAKRTFHEVHVDLSDCAGSHEIGALIENKLIYINQEDIVKIVLDGEIAEDLEIDHMYLNQTFEDKYYFMKIKDKTEIKIDYFGFEKDISLKGEFIRLLNGLNLPDDKKNKIAKCGINALIGREIL